MMTTTKITDTFFPPELLFVNNNNNNSSVSIKTYDDDDANQNQNTNNYNNNHQNDIPKITLQVLVPDAVWVGTEFLSPKECQKWIHYLQNHHPHPQQQQEQQTDNNNNKKKKKNYENHPTTSSITTTTTTTTSKKTNGNSSSSNNNHHHQMVVWEYIQHPSTKYIASRECYRMSKNDPILSHSLFERMIQSIPMIHTFFHSSSMNNSNNNNTTPATNKKRNHSSSSSSSTPKKELVTCNPNIRLYQYDVGMSGFGKHIDESVIIPNVGRTYVTVLIYLSTCTGGATKFYTTNNPKSRSVSYVPQQGSILFHIHGENCLLHEGEPVQKGVKYILRTDLVYKKS